MTNTMTAKILNVEQMAAQLTKAYVALVKGNVPFRRFPSVMLWGPPGVGKSQGVRYLARELQAQTGKSVHVTDVRLMLFNPVDLRGIPTSNAEKTLAVWLKPKIFQMDESADVINILFLDELSAAPQSVQAAAYQITLDRVIGEHKLPENCIVIAAGNRITDRSVAYQMPKALANRLCHMEIAADYNSWRQWAITAGIHDLVLGFLDYRPELLNGFDTESDENAFPTPRSWELVSNILTAVSSDVAEVYPLISGCVGEQAAYTLREWSEIYCNVPAAEEIFAGRHTGIPVRPMILFALSAQMASYARTCDNASQLENAIRYISRLPLEFRNKLFLDFLRIRTLRPLLKKNREFNEWFMGAGKRWEHYDL